MKGKRIALVCGGQGSQSKDLGGFLNLIKKYKVVDDLIKESKKILGNDRISSLLSLIENQDEVELTKTNNTQPLLYLHSCSVAKILESEGIINFKQNSSPNNYNNAVQCTFGHSLGEFAALVLSGSLNFSNGLELVEKRGFLMNNAVEKEMGEFLMAAIIPKTSEDFRINLSKICEEASVNTSKICQIANINASKQIVISGDKLAVENAISLGKSSKYDKLIRKSIPLKVGAPFHCSLLDSAKKPLQEMLDSISFNSFEIPFYSGVTSEKVIVIYNFISFY